MISEPEVIQQVWSIFSGKESGNGVPAGIVLSFNLMILNGFK
jgi:hypothetical protein